MSPATVREPARDIPVYRECDVLVVGAGPAGAAAAVASARMGMDTVLVERYGQLGGMSTGGLVVWIDRMTDWEGRQVIGGFADDIFRKLPADAVVGPAPELWGSKEPQAVGYWADRHSAHHGQVTWAPVVDPEMLKLAYFDLVNESGVTSLLHCWAVAPIQDGNQLKGIVFESKAGRQAVLAKQIIDATGDGDVFALAGAPFEGEVDLTPGNIHSAMNLAFRWGGVDTDRYWAFRKGQPEAYQELLNRAAQAGIDGRPSPSPRKGIVFCMAPKLLGYDCLNIQHLSEVEVRSRKLMLQMLEFYRANMPGYEEAFVLETAPQMGVRHSRRLAGVKKVVREDWMAGRVFEDEIGLCPSRQPGVPTVSIPLGCLLPKELDNLLAAGRNLSCDPATHTFLREVPVCWVMGQGAGVAAAQAVRDGVRVRDVDIAAVRRELRRQGAILQEERPIEPAPPMR